jgi:hypothetical protein
LDVKRNYGGKNNGLEGEKASTGKRKTDGRINCDRDEDIVELWVHRVSALSWKHNFYGRI